SLIRCSRRCRARMQRKLPCVLRPPTRKASGRREKTRKQNGGGQLGAPAEQFIDGKTGYYPVDGYVLGKILDDSVTGRVPWPRWTTVCLGFLGRRLQK